MWRKYQRRVLLAMSSQAFAQLVSLVIVKLYVVAQGYVTQNGINGSLFLYHQELQRLIMFLYDQLYHTMHVSH